MKKPEYYKFKLWLDGTPETRSIVRKKLDGKQTKFKAPITTRGIPKIYILKVKERIVYIGYTSQSISSRFNGGFRAKGENGYYGYQWKRYNRLDLTVFCFPPFSKVEEEREKEEKFAQAVEAELVYRVRKSTGEWPECQNEIHFFNNNKAKKVAAAIFNSINLT